MKQIKIGLLSFSIFFWYSISLAQDSLSWYRPSFEPSDLPVIKVKDGREYIFGYLKVPENRSHPSGRTIKLPVYIFKSRSETPQPDPIIYTVGGPGRTTMSAAPYMGYYRYLDDRDFILFEQRGTKYSQPHLDCPEWAEARHKASFPGCSENEADSLFRQAAADCRNRLLAQEIDLNAYHTNEIAADIEDLREVLGIEKYNLLTISYSTKIAQVLMRDYPEGIRSVVMDSPLPLEVNYDEQSVRNLLETYEAIFSDCEQETACNQAFPDLKNRFFKYLEEKTEAPLRLTVENPNRNKKEIFHLRGKDLINLLDASTTAEIPGLLLRMEDLLSGNTRFIEEQLQSLLQSPGDGAGMGMRLSVWCAEEMPFASRKTIQQETERHAPVKGLSPAVVDPEICDIWGVVPLDVTENQAVKSQIPTLLISGEYDSETPAKWARQMQRNLPNSYHLIFKGWCHTPTTYWDNPCGMEVANEFFNDPTRKPEVECFRSLVKLRFRLTK